MSATSVETVENIGRKLTPAALDALCERRAMLRLELEEIGATLSAQVEAYGFTPAQASKSKRLSGEKFQVTLSVGETTEIRDAQVETIEKVCPVGLFAKLFRRVTQYKLQSGASMLLAGTLPAGAPPNLRKMFAAAVILKPRAPSLKVERVGEEDLSLPR